MSEIQNIAIQRISAHISSVMSDSLRRAVNEKLDVRQSIQRASDLFLSNAQAETDKRLEFALRFLIRKPIKGDITQRKIKNRDLRIGISKNDFSANYSESERKIYLSYQFPFLEDGDNKISLNFDGETLTRYLDWCNDTN